MLFTANIIRNTRWGRYMLVSLVCLACITSLTAISRPVAAQTKQQTVIVQPGETLYRIALRYGVTVDAIVRANNLVDPSYIYAGQTLIIPNGAAPTPAAVAATSQPLYAVNYIVQPGDTLNHIAGHYGVTEASIIAANGLIDANHIEVGQAILVPGVSSAGSGPAVAPVVPTILVTPAPNGYVQPTKVPTAAPLITASPASTAAPIITLAPDVGAPSTVAPVTPVAAAPAAQIVSTYTVKAGEDLAAIARRFGLSWTELAAANNIADPNLIYAGMVLKIPAPNTTVVSASNGGSGSDIAPGPLSVDPNDAKQIVVVLHEERFYAYENGVLVRDVLVSTGLPMTPTVTGTYHIYVKYAAQLMVGPDYYLPNVPWISYFYEGYALHGTYWHHNWGHPMSHGCVNMPTDEAKWVYDWAPVGTTVTVVW